MTDLALPAQVERFFAGHLVSQKHASPHAAMTLLRSGAGCTTIALWLGHESIETTQVYLHADMEIKRRAMDLTRPTGVPEGVYKPSDDILSFFASIQRRPNQDGKGSQS